MNKRTALVAACILLFSCHATAQEKAQDHPLEVKGGHVLGESAEQFFSEGHEQAAATACETKDYKSLNLPNKRRLKDYCQTLDEARDEAESGKRSDYKGDGDTSELREDTYTFDGARLVKVELVFMAPSAESNYQGQPFEKILEGTRQAYGPPTSESAERVQDTYGAPYLAHRDVWLISHSAIVLTEKPGQDGKTTLDAFTRTEYDKIMAAQTPNPLK